MKGVVVAVLCLSGLLAGCTDFSGGGGNAISIEGIDVSAPDVGAGRLGLVVHVALHNAGTRSEAVNVTVRAYDAGTGLLVQTAEVAAGRLAKDRSQEVAVPIAVPRAATYRLVVDVSEDDEVVHRATVEARNLAGLEPNAHDTGLRIAASDFRVLSTTGNRTRIQASVYLTNEGSAGSRPLSLQVKAREDSTDLVVDEAWAAVGAVGLDATRLVNVTLEMPAGYNYVVEATLWDRDIIVERGEGRVQFAPTSTVPVGQDVVVTTPDLSDFRYDRGSSGEGSSKSPGPVLGLVAASLVGLALLRRRSA